MINRKIKLVIALGGPLKDRDEST